MFVLRSRIPTVLLGLGLTLATAGVLAYNAAPTRAEADENRKERHPHIHHVLHELRAARNELEKSSCDLGGHRAEAVKAIDHAVKQLETALEHDTK
jgi:hypothetical protein